MGIKIWHVYKMKQLKPGVFQFNVSLNTAAGRQYLKGFRLSHINGKNILNPPGYMAYGRFHATVKLSRMGHAIVRNKAIRARDRLCFKMKYMLSAS